MGWGYKDLYVPNSDRTRANKNILFGSRNNKV